MHLLTFLPRLFKSSILVIAVEASVDVVVWTIFSVSVIVFVLLWGVTTLKKNTISLVESLMGEGFMGVYTPLYELF